MNKERKLLITGLFLLLIVFSGPLIRSHCQVPCGIYDDAMRFKMIAEHITTLEKAMNQINELSLKQPVNYNQIVRWVMNKEKHAEELTSILTYYFLAQRLKPVPAEKVKQYKRYQKLLNLVHHLVIHTMKAKQSVDLTQISHLRKLLKDFKKTYSQK